jgi:hypothetical protein
MFNATERCNGWKNKATWLMSVWFSHDYTLSEYKQNREPFSNFCKEMLLDCGQLRDFQYDMMQYAISCVDWEELDNMYPAEDEEL